MMGVPKELAQHLAATSPTKASVVPPLEISTAPAVPTGERVRAKSSASVAR